MKDIFPAVQVNETETIIPSTPYIEPNEAITLKGSEVFQQYKQWADDAFYGSQYKLKDREKTSTTLNLKVILNAISSLADMAERGQVFFKGRESDELKPYSGRGGFQGLYDADKNWNSFIFEEHLDKENVKQKLMEFVDDFTVSQPDLDLPPFIKTLDEVLGLGAVEKRPPALDKGLTYEN